MWISRMGRFHGVEVILSFAEMIPHFSEHFLRQYLCFIFLLRNVFQVSVSTFHYTVLKFSLLELVSDKGHLQRKYQLMIHVFVMRHQVQKLKKNSA
jgi:hypothetical protein